MSRDLTSLLDDLVELDRSGGRVSIDDVIERIGSRGQGVTLLLPGLVGATPIGGLPGVPTIIGVLVALLSVQFLLGRSRLWLPDLIGRRSVDDGRLADAAERIRGPARWIDRHFGQRLEVLTGPAAERAAAALCLVFACLLPPLEVVPFAALIPFGAIALLGLALTLRDGILMLLAFAASAVALWGIWSAMPWVG